MQRQLKKQLHRAHINKTDKIQNRVILNPD